MMKPIEIDEGVFESTSDAASHVLKRWQKEFEISAQQINAGDCETFAYLVVQASAKNKPLSVTGCEFGGHEPLDEKWGGHVWVHDAETGLHYDAEAPSGVVNWKDLPFYKRKRGGGMEERRHWQMTLDRATISEKEWEGIKQRWEKEAG